MITVIAISLITSTFLLVFLSFYFVFRTEELIALNNWFFYPYMLAAMLFILILPFAIPFAVVGLLGIVFVIIGRIVCRLKATAVVRGDVLEA